MIDLETYLSENYGTCNCIYQGRNHCKCNCGDPKCTCGYGTSIRIQCEYWKSCNATSYEELSDWQKGLPQKYYVENGKSVGVKADGKGSSPST